MMKAFPRNQWLVLALAFNAACGQGQTLEARCETEAVELSAADWNGIDTESALASLLGPTPITVEDGSGQRSGAVEAELLGVSYWQYTALEDSNFCGELVWSEAHLDIRWTVTTDDGALNRTWSDAQSWSDSTVRVVESSADALYLSGQTEIGADGQWATVDHEASFYVLSVWRGMNSTHGSISAYSGAADSDTSEVQWTW